MYCITEWSGFVLAFVEQVKLETLHIEREHRGVTGGVKRQGQSKRDRQLHTFHTVRYERCEAIRHDSILPHEVISRHEFSLPYNSDFSHDSFTYGSTDGIIPGHNDVSLSLGLDAENV